MIRAIETQARGGHDAELSSVALSPDGRILATDGARGAVLWEVATGNRIRTLGKGAPAYTVDFSRDGRSLVTGGEGVQVWDVATGAALRTFGGSPDGIFALLLSRDGTKIATSGASQAPALWDFAAGRKIGDFDGNGRSSGPIAFSPDGAMLASAVHPYSEGASEGSVNLWLWDVTTRENVRTISRGHTGEINSVTFSPGGKTLATASADRTARLWSLT
jgi:WD40 repeat protein